jgi:cytochrome P450
VATTFVYDPTASDFQDGLHDVYRVLRDEHPVYHDPLNDSYSLSRFEDVWQAVHDPETFSSAGVAEAETLPGLIIYLDDPHHGWLRAIVSRAFTPKRIADLEPRVRELAAGLVGASVERGCCDVVHDLAAPLPSTVIAELLGVPAEHVASFRSWTEEFLGIASVDDFADAAANIFRLAGEILDARRRAPCDDLISALLAAEVDGVRLSDEDLLGFCFNLIIAGNDTTTSLIENGVSLLARHPDQRAELVEDPSLIPGAIEEMVRIDSPVQTLPRTSTREVELHGVTIPTGSRVQLVWGAANLDEREFTDPTRFDIHRTMVRHLGFGHGTHFCLGAALARLEARVVFEELLARAPDYEIDGEPLRYTSTWARSFRRLDIRV